MDEKELARSVEHIFKKYKGLHYDYLEDEQVVFTRMGDLYMMQTKDYPEDTESLSIFDQFGNVYWISEAMSDEVIEQMYKQFPDLIKNTDLSTIERYDALDINMKKRRPKPFKPGELPF